MTGGNDAQVSEAQTAVHWREESYYYPPPRFIAQANAADRPSSSGSARSTSQSASRTTRAC